MGFKTKTYIAFLMLMTAQVLGSGGSSSSGAPQGSVEGGAAVFGGGGGSTAQLPAQSGSGDPQRPSTPPARLSSTPLRSGAGVGGLGSFGGARSPEAGRTAGEIRISTGTFRVFFVNEQSYLQFKQTGAANFDNIAGPQFFDRQTLKDLLAIDTCLRSVRVAINPEILRDLDAAITAAAEREGRPPSTPRSGSGSSDSLRAEDPIVCIDAQLEDKKTVVQIVYEDPYYKLMIKPKGEPAREIMKKDIDNMSLADLVKLELILKIFKYGIQPDIFADALADVQTCISRKATNPQDAQKLRDKELEHRRVGFRMRFDYIDVIRERRSGRAEIVEEKRKTATIIVSLGLKDFDLCIESPQDTKQLEKLFTNTYSKTQVLEEMNRMTDFTISFLGNKIKDEVTLNKVARGQYEFIKKLAKLGFDGYGPMPKIEEAKEWIQGRARDILRSPSGTPVGSPGPSRSGSFGDPIQDEMRSFPEARSGTFSI